MVSPVQAQPRTTGGDLRAARVRRGLRAVDLALAVHLSRERICQIERTQFPRQHDIDRYFRALNSAEQTAVAS